MKHYSKPWRVLMLALLLASAVFTFTSCGNDEPKAEVINYYVSVEEELLVDGSTLLINRFYNPKTRMTEAIRSAYPTPDKNGNDEAVLAACDKEFETYKQMYEGLPEHLTCLICVKKATMSGYVVKHEEPLAYYHYDINAPIPPED